MRTEGIKKSSGKRIVSLCGGESAIAVTTEMSNLELVEDLVEAVLFITDIKL